MQTVSLCTTARGDRGVRLGALRCCASPQGSAATLAPPMLYTSVLRVTVNAYVSMTTCLHRLIIQHADFRRGCCSPRSPLQVFNSRLMNRSVYELQLIMRRMSLGADVMMAFDKKLRNHQRVSCGQNKCRQQTSNKWVHLLQQSFSDASELLKMSSALSMFV